MNVIDAAGRGTGEGLHLALNVGAMLISFLALIALVNAILGLAGLSMQQIFGWFFSPIAWSLGVPWRDAATVGNLLGTRMVLNEFVAYSQLGPLKATLDPKSFTIATFALCGFANFSSIGIQIGGIGALAPERRHDLARLGMRAMLAGTFANSPQPQLQVCCCNVAISGGLRTTNHEPRPSREPPTTNYELRTVKRELRTSNRTRNTNREVRTEKREHDRHV